MMELLWPKSNFDRLLPQEDSYMNHKTFNVSELHLVKFTASTYDPAVYVYGISESKAEAERWWKQRATLPNQRYTLYSHSEHYFAGRGLWVITPKPQRNEWGEIAP